MAVQENLKNLFIFPKGSSSVNVRLLPGTSAKIVYSGAPNYLIGMTNGVYADLPDGTWYSVVFDRIISGVKSGWLRADLVELRDGKNLPWSEASKSTTQAMIDAIVGDQQRIITNLTESWGMLIKLRAAGTPNKVLEDKALAAYSEWRDLQVRMMYDPNLALSGALSAGMEWVKKEMGIAGRKNPAIGIVPIIIAAVIIIGIGIIVYYEYKSAHETSPVKVKISDDIKTAVVAQLGQKRYDEFVVEQQDQMDESYRAGKNDSGSTFLGTVKFLAAAFVGIKAIQLLTTKENNKRVA